ncbi:helix-turn-helix domain-containing protein [Paenibacillus sinopodophylli]|uniref:helix-turn-helix domain-containing protein n=1 Tax=Paenibacillus sinopodophylli TaxID=1837342 RepID=UPI00110CD840|nr:helix-turn-helix transcriptional regulator [Paenibacillus sinopodophylli]
MTGEVGRCLLNKRLAEKGWNQQKLAEETGFDFRQISFWATDERVMSLRSLFIVSNVLDCDPRTLYEHGFLLFGEKVVK